MATFVPLQKDKGDVTANIKIEGIVFWHVLYVSDDGELKKDGTSSKTTTFPLGPPEKLHMDVNSWHIVISNQAKVAVKYEAGIVWTQSAKPVAQWPDNGPKGSLKTGETIVLDSSALLAIVPEAAPTPTTAKSLKKKAPK